MQLTNEFNSIIEWADKRGILESGTAYKQFIKLQEESGELAQGLLKEDQDLIEDSIGDCVVVLTILAKLYGTSIEQCINKAYTEISGRKGSMVNGVFVKD